MAFDGSSELIKPRFTSRYLELIGVGIFSARPWLAATLHGGPAVFQNSDAGGLVERLNIDLIRVALFRWPVKSIYQIKKLLTGFLLIIMSMSRLAFALLHLLMFHKTNNPRAGQPLMASFWQGHDSTDEIEETIVADNYHPNIANESLSSEMRLRWVHLWQCGWLGRTILV